MTGTLILAWQQSRADLEHLVLYSTDNCATRRAHTSPFRGDRLEIGTEFLPAGRPFALRALTSDGFQNGEARVAGLTLKNRLPTVAIQFPPDGAQAAPGYAWRLAGIAGDLEDQAIAGAPCIVGRWSSSRDGELGVGNTVRVELVGAGVPVTVTHAVSGGVPGGSVRLLARSAVARAPFGAGGVTAAFDAVFLPLITR